MDPYTQYCPVAKALELLDERWTFLVVRELLAGPRHFNELRRGVPRISPALLSRRLQRLTRVGVVERERDGARTRYRLTPIGQELEPVVAALGAWGVRWIGAVCEEELDPQILLWDMHRSVDHAALPPGRTTLRFRFRGLAGARSQVWWMVLTPEEAEICDVDPGFPVAAMVEAELACLVRVWRGDLTWSEALRIGVVVLDGPEHVRRAVPRWLGQELHRTLSAL